MTDRAAADAVAAARAAGRQAAATLPPITDPATLARLRQLLLPGARARRTALPEQERRSQSIHKPTVATNAGRPER